LYAHRSMKGKIKYYLKKPKSEIVKDLVLALAFGGVVALAASSPFFVSGLLKELSRRNKKTYNRQSFCNAFYRLKREGLLLVQERNHQIYISLTKEGERRAGRYQINKLSIQKQKRWDQKWRIVIFDVKHKQRIKREALRGFLKRLGFYQLQKSVWVYPYDCGAEIELLKDFFGFSNTELIFIVASHIQNDAFLRRTFHIN